ncbi:MAG: hypothetical protein PHS14_17455, partial [Elusimicrobia bacterium]|nr:hypothetical protein [Elusimicrobiota bacterium]
MTRLPLLALLLLVGAAPPGPKPADIPVIADAKALIKTSCAAAKESCVQTKALLDAYLVVLDDAVACMAKPCAVEKVNEIFERDRRLDEREHRLPPKARSVGPKRPLLRLSLFVITAAGLALEAAKPGAKAPVYTNAAVEASKVAESICQLGVGDTCAEARGVIRKADALNADASACEKNPCAFPEQERLAIAAEATLGGYFVFDEKTSLDTSAIYDMIRNARMSIAQMLARTSASKIAELESGEKALLNGVAKLEKNPDGANLGAQVDALNARGAAVLKLYQDASITSDRTFSLLDGSPEKGRLRERVNASAARLASARARLTALKTARGFGGGAETDRGAAGAVRAALSKAGDATLAVATLGAVRKLPASIPLDRRPVPMTPPLNPTAPTIIDA